MKNEASGLAVARGRHAPTMLGTLVPGTSMIL